MDEFVNIIHGMDAEELEQLQQTAFAMEVTAVAIELASIADSLAEHFDVYVVGAALAVVLADYEKAGGDES